MMKLNEIAQNLLERYVRQIADALAHEDEDAARLSSELALIAIDLIKGNLINDGDIPANQADLHNFIYNMAMANRYECRLRPDAKNILEGSA